MVALRSVLSLSLPKEAASVMAAVSAAQAESYRNSQDANKLSNAQHTTA
jgi:hypothetical protein